MVYHKSCRVLEFSICSGMLRCAKILTFYTHLPAAELRMQELAAGGSRGGGVCRMSEFILPCQAVSEPNFYAVSLNEPICSCFLGST